MADFVGKVISKYRIVAKLGRGGMAEVYKAFQPGLNRFVAIKVMHGYMTDDEDFVHRFEREATTTGKLRHPNIVQALDFDREGETYFMVMEFINGPTLKSELIARQESNQPYSLKEIARIFTGLGNALDYAHARAMVHRDLKPANVMINEDGQVVLTDFGIARIVGATQYTATGALAGTPAYMSPEQGQGERGDERSDIYALGVMLYEMVTGNVPYDADTPFGIIVKHISEPLPLPSKIRPDLPEEVEKVILKAMAKSPDDRFQTAGEMAAALCQAVGMAPGEGQLPLPTIATGPRLEELDPTGEFTALGATATPDATVHSAQSGATTMAPAAKGGAPTLPLIIGGGVIVLLIIGGIVGAFALLGGSTPTPTPTVITVNTQATSDAATAQANQTATGIALANANAATETAQAIAQLQAPTQTAMAATAVVEATIAQQTADAQLIASVLGAQNATATAIAQATQAANETATAEFLASITATPTPTNTPVPTNSPTTAPPTSSPTPAPPTATPAPQRAPISGRLAYPVDNGTAGYNVAIYDLSEDRVVFEIPDAHQPNFSRDGSKLVVNGEVGKAGIWEYNMAGFGGREVSGIATAHHPFYNKDANSIITDDPQQGGSGKWHLYAKIGLTPNDQTLALREARTGEIQSDTPLYPLWHDDFTILIRACGYWSNGACGVWRLLGFQLDGPAEQIGAIGGSQLVLGKDVVPTDIKGNRYAYMSKDTGNWEVYIASADGGEGLNVSNNPAIDGLPTISPDGDWVAFLSNRGGGWDIWIVSTSGGEAQPLNIEQTISWHPEYGGFENERMSWGR